MSRSMDGTPPRPGRVRQDLRRRIEHERVQIARVAALLGVDEEDPDAIHDAVERLIAERDELRRRVVEGESPPSD